MRRLVLLILILLLAQTASAWPLFTVPSIQEIKKAEREKPCERNPEEFRISGNALIPATFTGRAQPSGWFWTSSQESPCFWKNQELPLTKIEIRKNYNEDGQVLYSTISAHFQAPNGSSYTLNLTTPEEYWDCYPEKRARNYITCANDTFSESTSSRDLFAGSKSTRH